MKNKAILVAVALAHFFRTLAWLASNNPLETSASTAVIFASGPRLYSVFTLVILASHNRPPRLDVTLGSVVSNTVMSVSNSLVETSASTAAKMG